METPAPQFGDHIGAGATAPALHEKPVLSVADNERATTVKRAATAPFAPFTASFKYGGDVGGALHLEHRLSNAGNIAKSKTLTIDLNGGAAR
jgi:hypothetical protein